MSDKRERVLRWTERLVADILSTKEKRIRTSILAERLKRLKAETIVMVIDEICRKAEEKVPGYQEALFSLIDIQAITAILGYPKMSEVYLSSKRMGCERVTRLLVNPPPKKGRYSEYDFVEGESLEHITLGEKRSLAKGYRKDTLDRLLYDPDPHVIRNLLSNPMITERDVLKIASKRPNSVEVLTEVFNNKKWSERYSVKRALVKNPYTPTRLSLGLVNFLLLQDLKEISRDETVHPAVRDAAEEIIKKRKG
jgi:hypothetical protein